MKTILKTILKTLKYYWARFISKVPPALRKLRDLCLAIAAMGGVALGVLSQYNKTELALFNILVYAVLISSSVATGIQFSTSKPELQQKPL